MEFDASQYPELRFFDELGEILKTGNRLPHWEQRRATYFVTFRLGDSIPATVLSAWRSERDQWLAEHPLPLSADLQQEYHKRFSAKMDHFLDQAHGSCLLRNPQNHQIVSRALMHFQKQRYLLHTHVIMPNHVHLLLSLGESESLKSLVNSWKRFTSTSIQQHSTGGRGLWQKDYFDRIIRDWDHFANVARYIRGNPAKAKLRVGEYMLEESPWIQRLLA